MFFCENCEIFKNTYFEEHLRTAASVFLYYFIRVLEKKPPGNLPPRQALNLTLSLTKEMVWKPFTETSIPFYFDHVINLKANQ